MTASKTSFESQASGVVGGWGPGPTGLSGFGPGCWIIVRISSHHIDAQICQELLNRHLVLTIERLDAIDIIPGQNKGVRVAVCVNGVHESTRISRMRQSQGVTKLMGSHQEQDITCSRKDTVTDLSMLLLLRNMPNIQWQITQDTNPSVSGKWRSRHHQNEHLLQCRWMERRHEPVCHQGHQRGNNHHVLSEQIDVRWFKTCSCRQWNEWKSGFSEKQL